MLTQKENHDEKNQSNSVVSSNRIRYRWNGKSGNLHLLRVSRLLCFLLRLRKVVRVVEARGASELARALFLVEFLCRAAQEAERVGGVAGTAIRLGRGRVFDVRTVTFARRKKQIGFQTVLASV